MKIHWQIPPVSTLLRLGLVLALLSFILGALPAADARASAMIWKDSTPVLKPLSHPEAASATTWFPLPNDGLDSSVLALALSGTDLYVGGRFNQTGDGTLTWLNNIVRYDTAAGLWQALPSRGGNHVYALAMLGSDLYAGGIYTGSNDLSSIARYDTVTSTWHALNNNGLNGNVITLAVVGTDLYVAGGFTETGDGTLTDLGGIARYDTLTGVWHELPHQGLNDTVWTLAVSGTDLYVGGGFTQTGDGMLNLGNIARYDTAADLWHAFPNQGLDSSVRALAVSGGDLYLAGTFSQTGDGTLTDLGYAARYDTAANAWHALPNQGLDSTAYALDASDSDLYFGGTFSQTGDGTLGNLGGIARYNSASGTWHPMPNEGFDNTVLVLAVFDSDLYVGGFFHQTGDGSLMDLGYIARGALTSDTYIYLPLVIDNH